MTDFNQELLTPDEAATWFRRSALWVNALDGLVVFSASALGGPGHRLYHIRCLRAFVLGWMEGLRGDALRQRQLSALAVDCGLEPLSPEPRVLNTGARPVPAPPPPPPNEHMTGGPL